MVKIAPLIATRIKAATRGRIQISTVVVIRANMVNSVIFIQGNRSSNVFKIVVLITQNTKFILDFKYATYKVFVRNYFNTTKNAHTDIEHGEKRSLSKTFR